MSIPTLHQTLSIEGNIWHFEIGDKPLCEYPFFATSSIVCEVDLSFWNNEVLCRTLDKIQVMIGMKPTLVKGKCPHTNPLKL